MDWDEDIEAIEELTMLVDRDQVALGQEGDAPTDTTGVVDPPVTEQTGATD